MKEKTSIDTPRDKGAFSAYRSSLDGHQRRSHFVHGLSLFDVQDTERFPLGKQFDEKGEQYVWQYGVNGGQIV